MDDALPLSFLLLYQSYGGGGLEVLQGVKLLSLGKVSMSAVIYLQAACSINYNFFVPTFMLELGMDPSGGNALFFCFSQGEEAQMSS